MATVGDRYQVVIERDVREELQVKPGDRAVETVEDGRLVITFVPERHDRSLRGSLRPVRPVKEARGRVTEVRDDQEIGQLVADRSIRRDSG